VCQQERRRGHGGEDRGCPHPLHASAAQAPQDRDSDDLGRGTGLRLLTGAGRWI
jgi:hypothetical protein